MKKLLLSLGILCGGILSLSTAVGAASVSPSNQSIKGSTATASWTFTWTANGANEIWLVPDYGATWVPVDSNNTGFSSRVSYTYQSSADTNTYHPSFYAIRKSDGTSQVASATVYKTLY